jgi:hypothetical protein
MIDGAARAVESSTQAASTSRRVTPPLWLLRVASSFVCEDGAALGRWGKPVAACRPGAGGRETATSVDVIQAGRAGGEPRDGGEKGLVERRRRPVVGETRGRRRALAGGDGAVVGEWHARESEEVETRWDFRFNLLAVNGEGGVIFVLICWL